MQFFKLVGAFAAGSGGQGRKRTADENVDLLAAKSEAFNKGLRGRAFFYVVNASGGTFTAMAVQKDPRMNMNPQFPAYTEALGVKLTDIHAEEIPLHTDFLCCVIWVICNYGLKITRKYWPKKPDTYNIEVKHCGHIGNEKIKYNIQFRVNNHINQTLNRGPKFNGSREMTMPVLQDIRVGKFEPSIYPDAMLYINKICKEIKENHEFTEGTPAT